MADHQSLSKEIDQPEATRPDVQDLVASLPRRDGWSTTPLTLYNNYWLRSHMVAKFMLVRDNFKPRRDDVVLATHPKSGTTWLKSLAFTIFNRSRFTFANTPLLKSNPQLVVPFIGTTDGELDHLETLPSPRLLSTHLPLSLLPPAISTVGCKVVYLCREPKDSSVSRWHFENKIATGAPVSLDDAFHLFCQGVSPFGPFWDHYLEYWKESLARPHEVMFLRYEEIVSDPLKVVRKLATFLGVPFTEEEEESGVAEEIVSFCSFESLRNLDVNKTAAGVERAGGKLFLQGSALFRKGKVGDWVNHMSKDMGEAMDRLVQDKFKGSGLEF
ncbi:cytosolic sulfotransferase 15-like [Lolium rigidum]|uniref:cytosolic sulfotransferase 15-like n=1 Tax=Lolium rigidum TaxID=89674 RepID=UPI001F5CBFB7|nr:cytosolic sulfotransferase 15-like [Lolium rigidum]